MAKNPSPFPSLLLKVSIFSFLLSLSSAYHSSIPHSYTHLCSSTVPLCSPTEPELTTIPFPPNQDGYYIGGDGISNVTRKLNSSSSSWYYNSGARKIFVFRTNHVQKTECPEVYKVTADLILQTSGMSYYRDFTSFSYSYSPHVIVNGVQKGPLTFQMEGFWSPGSRKMCMVGFGDVVDGDDTDDHGRGRLSGVLKMSNVTGSSELTSLVTGTLESDVGEEWSYKPVSMLLFPRINYEYKHARRDGKSCDGGSGDIVLPQSKESLSLPLSTSICSPFFSSSYPLHLNYAKPCNVSSSSPAKSCSPLENHHEDEPDHRLPRFMSLRLLECSNEKQSLRFLMEFSNNSDIGYYDPFSPNTTLVSEGTWDAKNNRLCIVACRIRDATNASFGASKVEDCSIRMSLRFPATWSMGNTSTMVGEIWSSLDAGDSAYFRPISVKDGGGHRSRGLPGLKYEYTMVEKANASCSKVGKSATNGGKTKQFPNGRSDEMRFDMSFKDSLGRKKGGWGRAEPIFVGDQVPYWVLGGGVTIVGSDSDRVPAKSGPPSKPVNISYSISYTPLNANSSGNGFWVLAEGVYEAETGQLCMVGCKSVSSSSSRYAMSQELDEDSKDCEVSITVEFPSVDSNDYIQGRIESTREKANDPRYFEPLVFAASSFYSRRARESVWRMDLEVIMALISNTLLCVFVCYQIFHLRRNPEVFPFLSFLMLVVLALGHLIPLVLNFDELLSRKQERRGQVYYWRRSGGTLEVDEVILRVVTMVVLVLHLRLLQLTWLARQANKDKKASIKPAETKALLVTLPLYILGALIALSINWKHYEFGVNDQGSHHVTSSNNNQHSIATDLRSYAGLLLDGFLLPQILLNIFHDSSTPGTSILSRPFYVGITVVRLAPHGYDLFRAQNFVDYFDWSYIYANPDGDYYSTWSDVIIPLVCLMFAVIIYLQQRFGGRCFLPKKLRRVEGMYQKVAVIDDEEQMEEKSHVVAHLPSV